LVCSELPLFRLTRKLAAQKRTKFRGTHANRYIVSVEPRESTPVRCIEVDHPSHCYLASRAMIPTHNTLGTLFRFGWHADKYPGYFGAIFRREMPMVTAGGGLWEESMKLYPMWGARPNISMHEWRWPRGRSLIQFRSLQHEKDVLNYQGAQLAEFALEEATHFPESVFWYLLSRLRSNCGMRPRACLTFNPDPDSWVRKLIDWYIDQDGFAIPERAGLKRYFLRDGDELVWGDSPAEVRELAPHVASQPLSFRFIPSMLADNPKIDQTYKDKLDALPLVERARLKGGNWNIRAKAGTIFKRVWFEILDRLPHDVHSVARGWDLAATEPSQQNKEPDWTRGTKISRHHSGLYVAQNMVSRRERPHTIDALTMQTAHADGRNVRQCFWQDPGAAGKAEAQRYVRMLAGFDVRIVVASENKVTYANPVSAQAEGGNFKLLRGDWNEAFLNEMEGFPDARHDDIPDSVSRAFLDLTSSVTPTSFYVPGM
jgi:predicted phage terminase large subunit-like protein